MDQRLQYLCSALCHKLYCRLPTLSASSAVRHSSIACGGQARVSTCADGCSVHAAGGHGRDGGGVLLCTGQLHMGALWAVLQLHEPHLHRHWAIRGQRATACQILGMLTPLGCSACLHSF